MRFTESSRNKKAVVWQGEPRDAAVNFVTVELYNKSNGTFMYAKHGNLVDVDASGAKTSKSILNHV